MHSAPEAKSLIRVFLVGLLVAFPTAAWSSEFAECFHRTHERYRDALERYASWSEALARSTLVCLQRALAEESDAIDSQRALFDLWVDCAEAAYAEAVAEEDFPLLCGELVNALVGLRAAPPDAAGSDE